MLNIFANKKLGTNKELATEEYVNNKTKYSTEEIVIGTWIDGKPIYRKTISVPNFSTTTINVNTGITNISEIIKVFGSWKRPDVPNDIYSFDNTFMAQFAFRISTGIFSFGTNNVYVTFYGKVTIEYTKTTD